MYIGHTASIGNTLFTDILQKLSFHQNQSTCHQQKGRLEGSGS